jgi:hypothetical protein
MTWGKVAVIIGGVVVPIAGLLAWGHADLSRDIERLDGSIAEVRQDLSGFKDQSYERFADIQKQTADARAEIAHVRADIAELRP